MLAWERIRRSSAPIGGLLMDQKVLAGVGNVYRAEILYRHRMHPLRPGRTLRVGQWQEMWDDLVGLMAEGRPHRPDRHGPPRAHARGDGAAAASGRPWRRGVRLPAYRSAVSRLRTPDPHRRTPGQEPLLVRPMPARIPLPSRTLRPGMTMTRTQPQLGRIETTRHPRTSLRRHWRNFVHRGLSTEQRTALMLTSLALAITVAVYLFPDDMPFSSLMLPAPARQHPARTAHPAVVRGLHPAVRHGSVSQQTNINGRTVAAIAVQFAMGMVVLATGIRRSNLGVTGTRGESMLVDLRDRILTQGTIPDLPAGLGRPVGAALGRRYAVRWRLRRRLHLAGCTAPRRRGRGRVGQGRGGRHPGAAAVRRVRRAADRTAARRVPARRQRLPAPPGLGRGVRDRDPPLSRPRLRRLRGAHRRASAGGSPGGGVGPLAGAADRGADPRPDRGRDVHLAYGVSGPATRCSSIPTAWSRSRAATSTSASTGCWARRSRCCAGASTTRPPGSPTRSGSPDDDRALLVVHRR